MKISIDLRHLAACFICVGIGYAASSHAGTPPVPPPPPPPPEGAYHATVPVPGVTRWDFKCVNHESAGADQNWANHDLNKPNGWNPFLKKMGAQGWEPAVFIAPQGVILAVCFRRPLTPE